MRRVSYYLRDFWRDGSQSHVVAGPPTVLAAFCLVGSFLSPISAIAMVYLLDPSDHFFRECVVSNLAAEMAFLSLAILAILWSWFSHDGTRSFVRDAVLAGGAIILAAVVALGYLL